MGLRLVVLNRQQVDDGEAVVGRIEQEDGVSVLAFAIQPNLETAFWALEDGRLVVTPDDLRSAIHLVLTAALQLPGGATSQSSSSDPLETVQQAWRWGLAHGWAAAQTGKAEETYQWLESLVWPAQLRVALPTGVNYPRSSTTVAG